MKSALFLFSSSVLFLTVISVMAPVRAVAEGPKFEYTLENNRLDLGTFFIDELEPFDFQVEFTNEGSEPLLVSNVRGCCGTQIPDWTKEPIMPGDTGTIQVRFRLAPRVQTMNRTVTAVSNDAVGVKILRMTLRVIERKED